LNAPRWIRSLIARRTPDYLFRRNVVGPTSVVVARRSMYPRFDPELTWLIDVDAYYRLFTQARSIRFSGAATVASVLNRTDSITASLRPDLKKRCRQELAYLARKHPDVRLLSLLSGEKAKARAFRTLETLSWAGFKASSLLVSAMRPPPIARSAARLTLRGVDRGEA
jgi:hypothetical protein